jgi:hypothetical protein
MEDQRLLAGLNLSKLSKQKPDVRFSHKETYMLFPFSDVLFAYKVQNMQNLQIPIPAS